MWSLKRIGVEIYIFILLVIVFFVYIARIKSKSKQSGALEQKILHLEKQKETIDKADSARREFGTMIEALEHDDRTQFIQDPTYKPLEINQYKPDCVSAECLQFRASPFREH